MAKPKNNVAVLVSDGIDRTLLAQIVAGTVNFVSQVQGQPMVSHAPPLIEINLGMPNPADPTQVACRATPAAVEYLTAVIATPVAAAVAPVAAHSYALITGAVLPEPKKRGNSFGSGAPTKYPFADMPVGASFFSPNSEHKHGDAVKGLGSTVSSQNKKYSEGELNADNTPKMKVVTRAVRDEHNKAKLDANGKKITETVSLPVLKYNRKFTIRPVEAGKTYGNWVAPEAGALIARTL